MQSAVVLSRGYSSEDDDASTATQHPPSPVSSMDAASSSSGEGEVAPPARVRVAPLALPTSRMATATVASPTSAPATAGSPVCPSCRRDRFLVTWAERQPQRIYMCTNCRFAWTAAHGGQARCVRSPSADKKRRFVICNARLTVELRHGEFVYACTDCRKAWTFKEYAKRQADYVRRCRAKGRANLSGVT